MSKITVTLTKSLIGRKKNQIATANSMGLRKIGDVTVQENNEATKGKINLIAHLITVKEG
ncbi:MAG: 50S ribosomal protein L30 [Eubacteriales bacterium]